MVSTKLKVGAASALIVIAVLVPVAWHLFRQEHLQYEVVRGSATRPEWRAGVEGRNVSLYMVFAVTVDGKINLESKIIETPSGLSLTKEDCGSDDALTSKGALLMTSPKVVIPSGERASLFVGSQQPGSRIPREGVALEILPVLVGGNIHYTGSVAVFKPPRKGEVRATRLSAAARPQVRSNAFAGDCKVGEAVLHTATSDGRN